MIRKCLNCKKPLPNRKDERKSKPFKFCKENGLPKCKWAYYYANKRKPYYQERYISQRGQ